MPGEVASKSVAKSPIKRPRTRRRNGGYSPLKPVEGVNYDVLPHQVGFWVRRAHLAVMRSYEQHSQPLGLRPVETAAILILDRNPNLSQMALAATLGSDQSSMVAISTKLEKRGLIRRKRAREDRRFQFISLTADGEQMAQDIRKALAAHDRSLTRNMTAEQRRQFIELLKQLVG